MNGVTLSPNPAKGMTHITLRESQNDVTYRIIGLDGKMITEKRRGSSNGFDIDLTNLAPGIYFVEVNSENENLTKVPLVVTE
jgi:hypothetical protein